MKKLFFSLAFLLFLIGVVQNEGKSQALPSFLKFEFMGVKFSESQNVETSNSGIKNEDKECR